MRNKSMVIILIFTLLTGLLGQSKKSYKTKEINLQTSYSLAVENSMLIAQHRRHDDFVLQPQETDVFTASNWAFGRVEFVREINKKICGFRLNSGRVRNLIYWYLDPFFVNIF